MSTSNINYSAFVAITVELIIHLSIFVYQMSSNVVFQVYVKCYII